MRKLFLGLILLFSFVGPSSASVFMGGAAWTNGASFNADFMSGVLDSRFTFTRASNAWRFNSAGNIEVVSPNLPRFDYNPVTLEKRGIAIEEVRSNLFLNSETPVSQNITTTATGHTLTFYGTGTITLSGTATNTTIGAGAYPTRTTYTFTPTAGTLSLTVTGDVQHPQLEVGSYATSYIVSGATPYQRAQEKLCITTPTFVNATNGSLVVDFETAMNAPSGKTPTILSTGGANTLGVYASDIRYYFDKNTVGGLFISNNIQFGVTRLAATYAAAGVTGKVTGQAVKSSATTIAAPTTFCLGSNTSGTNNINGWIYGFRYWPRKLSSTELGVLVP